MHTQAIGRLGWLEAVTTRLHPPRTTRAIRQYIDRCNYAGVLVIWDRLFGTWRKTGRQLCVYGINIPYGHNRWCSASP